MNPSSGRRCLRHFGVITVTSLVCLPIASAQNQINTIPVVNSAPALADINNTNVNHLVYVAIDDGLGHYGFWVHALDGAAVPPYSQELPGFPKMIWNDTLGLSPTVSVGDINFSSATQPPGYLSLVVGGDLGTGKQVFAFKCDVLGVSGQCDPDPMGGNVPGFPAVAYEPNFFNAIALRSAIVGPTVPPVLVAVDGSPALISATESTFLHRHNGLGVLRQCQVIAEQVAATPALGYVGPHGAPLMYDGTPQEVAAGYSDVLSPLIRTFDSWGKTIHCGGAEDLLFDRGAGEYGSSPALGDLDGDGLQDIVIANGSTNNLEVFASQQGAQTVRLSSGLPSIGTRQYSSPAIVTFDGANYDTIIATDDGGYVHALKYDRTAIPHLSERPGWPRQLDGGVSISASPLVAQLQPDVNGPQIIVANDAGKVHILRAGDASDLVPPFTVGSGEGSQVWSTPVVGTRRVNLTGDTCSTTEPTNCPLIEVLNGKGAWEIVLSGFPPFDPTNAQWATFHRSNSRTGALTPDQDGSAQTTQTKYGSIGGLGQGCTSVKLYYDGTENPVPDYYGGNATATPLSDGRYLFEFVQNSAMAGLYKVRFNDSMDLNGIGVDPSLLTIVSQSCQ